MKSSVKAVILDWAGTSVDFGSLAPVKVFIDVFNEKGIKISNADARKFMGIDKRNHTRKILALDHVREQWQMLYDLAPQEMDVEDIFSRLEPKLAEVACELCEPIPGAIDFLEDMRELGIKVGSTTGYVKSMMDKIVPVAESKGFMPDCVVNSSEVQAGRPFPYMCYLNALKMNVFPFSHMIKIGDTEADVLEGLNAGMWTIGLSMSGNEMGLSQDEISVLGDTEREHLTEGARTRLKQAGAHYVADGIWDCLPLIPLIEERINRGERP